MRKWLRRSFIGLVAALALVGAATLVGLAVLGPFGFGFILHSLTFVEAFQPWRECVIEHPGGSPALVFKQKSVHPFLAEYDYKVQFGTGRDAVERWLPLNYGGRTKMNAYWYPETEGGGPAVRLQDRHGEYLLRLDERKTYLLLRYRGHVFAGEILEGRIGHGFGWKGSRDAPMDITAEVNGQDAPEITGSTVASDPGLYFGRIQDDRFIPLAETPEEEIVTERHAEE